MRTIKVMADYFCYPLWEPSNGDSGNLSPETLPISESLRAALMLWAKTYDAILDIETGEAGFKTQRDADEFRATGFELVDRLQNELGPDFKIVHYI